MFFIFKGGQVYPVPPLFFLMAHYYPHSAPNPLAIPAQTALAGTGIYTIPTARIQTHRKDRSENSSEPLRKTRGGQGTPDPP